MIYARLSFREHGFFNGFNVSTVLQFVDIFYQSIAIMNHIFLEKCNFVIPELVIFLLSQNSIRNFLFIYNFYLYINDSYSFFSIF